MFSKIKNICFFGEHKMVEKKVFLNVIFANFHSAAVWWRNNDNQGLPEIEQP